MLEDLVETMGEITRAHSAADVDRLFFFFFFFFFSV
jgi:hypothetical protein